jgi:hypothetical protein
MHSRNFVVVPDDEWFDPFDLGSISPQNPQRSAGSPLEAENTCPVGTLSRTYIPELLKAHNSRLTMAARL